MSGMTEQLLPAGPHPLFVAWFFASDIKLWESVEDAKRAVNVSPVIGWIYDVGAERLPIPVGALDGEVRAPEKVRFIAGSEGEARMNAETMALSRYSILTGPQE